MKFNFNKQITLIIIVLIIGFFGSFWVSSLSNIEITLKTEMDENTLEYLSNHDYCIYNINQPYDSEFPSYVFMGDCEYLNNTEMVNN